MFSAIDNLSVGKLRARGYFKAFEQNGMAIDPDLIVLTDSDGDLDHKMQTVFDTNKVDGVFALDEHASTMAMKIAIKKGIKIPDELSVIGFADGVWSRRMTPSLSTISQHGPEIGEAAAAMLIQRLESKEEEKAMTKVIKTELRQRDSTRKLK